MFHRLFALSKLRVVPAPEYVGKRLSSSVPRAKVRFAYPDGEIPPEEDYVEEPEYPEIDEETHTWTESKRLRRQKLLDYHQSIRSQPTPESKTVQMNMPRNYGWKTTKLSEQRFAYDSQEFYQFVTRTHLASDQQLPELYSSPELSEKAKHYADKMKGPLLEAINFELEEQTRSFENDPGASNMEIEFKKSQSLIAQMNRVILMILGNEISHLQDCQIDYTPKLEAFWVMGGHQPTPADRAQRKTLINRKLKWKRYPGTEDDPVQTRFQFSGSPLLQLRCENSIENFVDRNSPLCLKQSDAQDMYPYTLNHLGFPKENHYASLITGTWAGDTHKCSHIGFHPRHHLHGDSVQRSEHWKADSENAISSQASLASFGRLLSQALYFGFDQFSDLDYPFSTQTIITDGLQFSFCAYQLNTIKLCNLYLKSNMKQNICWKSKSMSIFDENKPDCLNNETLEMLLKFYLNPPSPIPVENPTPYLKFPLAEWDDEIQRETIFYNYRDMVAQRWLVHDSLLHRRTPEIYNWERIYKINHPTRHMDARRRFFEFPEEFPGKNTSDLPYTLLDPRYTRRRFRAMQAEVTARKEAEALKEAKRIESAKYGIVDEDN